MATRRIGSIVKRGPKKWLVTVNLGRDATGKRRTRSKTVKGSKATAEAALAELVKYQAVGRLQRRSTQTLEDLITEWLETVVPLTAKPQTVQSYRSALTAYVVPSLGAFNVETLRPKHFRLLAVDMQNSGKAPGTIRLALGLARQVLEFAVGEGRIEFNPTDRVRVRKAQAVERQGLDLEQLARLQAACLADSLAPLWMLMLCTGIRPGEAMGLKWQDIDFNSERPTITIRRTIVRISGEGLQESEPKSARARRTIPIPPDLVPMLRAHKADQAEQRLKAGPAWQDAGYVFANHTGGARDWSAVRARHWKPIAEAAGLPSMVPYGLRHEQASQLIAAGVDIATVSERLGHADASITLRVYTHPIPGAQDVATGVMGQVLFGS